MISWPFVLSGIVTLVMLGAVLGWYALRSRSVERFVFNAVAFLLEVQFPMNVLMAVLVPPFLSVLAAWLVLKMAGRDDPFE